MTKPSHAIQVGGTTHPDAPLPAHPTEPKSKQRHPSRSQSNRTQYDHVKILQPYPDGPSPQKQNAQSPPQTQKQTMPGPQPKQSRPAAGIRFPEVLWLPIPYHLAQNDRPRRRSRLPERAGAHLVRRTVLAFEMLSRCKEPEAEKGERLQETERPVRRSGHSTSERRHTLKVKIGRAGAIQARS